jgi:tRNA (guanosine-2'-O-)-methyltransferase
MEGRTIRSKTAVRQLHRTAREGHGEVEIAFYLQDWSDAYNVGGLFRVADACGAAAIFASGKTPGLESPQVAVTSLGHHRRVPFRAFARHDEAVEHIRSAGYSLIALEIAEGAEPYAEFDWPKKVCLALGNEQNGLYSSVQKHRDAAVFIPMFGKGRSLNVHVSAAVVAFHIRFGRGPD